MTPTEKDAEFWAWFGDEPMPNGGMIAARPSSEVARKAASAAPAPIKEEAAAKAARLLIGPISPAAIGPLAENIRQLAALCAARREVAADEAECG